MLQGHFQYIRVGIGIVLSGELSSRGANHRTVSWLRGLRRLRATQVRGRMRQGSGFLRRRDVVRIPRRLPGCAGRMLEIPAEHSEWSTGTAERR
jgi:hypothetical protein